MGITTEQTREAERAPAAVHSRPIPREALPHGPGATTRALIAVLLLIFVLLPHIGSAYWTGLVMLICIYGTVNVSWNLVLGYGGLFTFGQMGFFAVGAYSSAIVNIHAGLSPWVSTAAGACAAALAGAIIGLPSLRLSGPYMVLFTLAFQEIVYVIAVTDTSGILGGGFGLQNLGGYTFPGLANDDASYYFGLLMLVGAAGIVEFLVRSPIGVATQALRDSRASATARGVSLIQHRTIIFVISAGLTGVAGAFYAHFYSIITPQVLSIGLLVSLLAMIIIGGLGSTGGVIAGTALLVYINDQLATQQQYSAILWGGIIILVILLMPGGISGAVRSIRDRANRVLDAWFGEEELASE